MSDKGESLFRDALKEWVAVFMHRSMHDLIFFAKERNLSMSQIGALLRISHAGACGVSDIGDDLGVTNAAASQMLERLVQQGLVVRAEDPHDRRAKRIELSEQGKTVVEGTVEARQRWFNELSSRLTAEELSRSADALRLLAGKMKELENRKR